MYQQPPQQPPGWGPPGYPPQGYGPPPQPPKSGTSKALVAVAAICGICVVCMVAGALGQKNGGPGSSSGFGGSTSPAQRQYVTQSCAEVTHLFGSQSRTSDLQQDELWRQYDDRWVRWAVTVGEVTESLGRLQVQFRCGTESLLFDGHAYFGDDQRARLLTVTPGSVINFEGRLTDHGRLMGLSIEDATLSQ